MDVLDLVQRASRHRFLLLLSVGAVLAEWIVKLEMSMTRYGAGGPALTGDSMALDVDSLYPVLAVSAVRGRNEPTQS